jgi:hypothetical protein
VRRSDRVLLPILLLALGAVAGAGSAAAAGGASEIRHPEDLFIVDCLLPAKVRSLGRMTKFAAPRRVARLSAHECSLRGGEFSRDPQDNAYALQAWLAQAEGGDAEAMNNVGEIYEQGVRGAPDYGRAAEWYRKAAEAGNRRAQTNLAALYEQGKGVAQDTGAALSWYRRAAGMTTDLDLAAQKEIDQLRAELDRARGEAADARSALDRLRAELEGARTDLTDAENRVRELRAQADAATRDAHAARADADAARRENRAREAAPALAEATATVATKRQRVAELEAAQDRYRRMLGELEAQERSGDRIAALRAEDLVGKPGPSIQFVRPDVLATRGPSLAPLPADAAEVEVVGRVEAPLGLATLLADGRPVSADENGWFEVRLPARAGATVRFVALDRASRKAEAEIQFVRPAAAPESKPAAPSATATRPSGRRAFALVVADGAYRSLAPLATARSDGEAIAQVLRDRYGYQTTLLADATFLDTMRALSELGSRLRAGDDLLVYFAGHGRLAADGRAGYWLPVDAAPEDASTWIPNAAIARLLGSFAADRILVISDSCYAGTLAAGALAADATGGSTAPGDRAQSRWVLTSGGLQPVLDQGGDGRHSIFARALLTVLQLADRPLSVAQVADAVAARVTWTASRLGLSQTPELAPIRAAGHEAGDFVLAPLAAGG